MKFMEIKKYIENKSQNNKFLLISIIFLLISISNCCFVGCGKKSSGIETSKQVVQRPKPKIPEYIPTPQAAKYTYKGGLYRDPLIPAGGSSSYSSSTMSGEGGETMTDEKMSTLQLKGIFKDSKTGNIAIISETSGGSYILKNGKLYDRKNKIVKGVAGVVGKNSTTLFSNNAKIELKLKKSGEEKK